MLHLIQRGLVFVETLRLRENIQGSPFGNKPDWQSVFFTQTGFEAKSFHPSKRIVFGTTKFATKHCQRQNILKIDLKQKKT